MSEQKKSVYQSLRGIFGDFIFSIALFIKGVLSALIFAWVVTKIPFVALQMGIAENNLRVQAIMTAGDITSVVYALIAFWKDLKLAFWS